MSTISSRPKDLHLKSISFTMSGMRPSAERGYNVLILPFVLALLFLVGSVIFGVWSYGRMLDYKNNLNIKIDSAVKAAVAVESDTKDAQFAQAEKNPFKTYTGPSAYGSVTIKYPNTWSAYVIDDTNSTPYVDGYFYPNTVPDTQSSTAAFALRLQIVQDSYSNVLSNIQNNVQQGLNTVAPYKAPNVPSIVGSLITGMLPSTNRSGTMVVLPLRNTTLELWTEAPQFESDFSNIVLKNFTFLP